MVVGKPVTVGKCSRRPQLSKRDFLLPAPSLNNYDQGYALQNRVLRELKTAGTRLFQHPVTNFWTPHSGRAYLPTATQVLAFPERGARLPRRLARSGERPLRQDSSSERSSTCNARLHERTGQGALIVLRKKKRHCLSTISFKRKGC